MDNDVEPLMVDLNHIDYEVLRDYLGQLPQTWYPDLIRAMVEAAYEKDVFVRPHGGSRLIRRIEKDVQIKYILAKAMLGMTRDEVVAVLGEPDDKSIGTRKYPTPAVYKYGQIELHFQPWKAGKLGLIFDGKKHVTLAKSIPSEK